MKKRLIRVAPLRAGIILAILYGVLGLFIAPIMILAALAGKKTGAPGMAGVAIGIAVPFLYAIAGFVGGIILAALYNLVAKWTGGLQVEVVDDEVPMV